MPVYCGWQRRSEWKKGFEKKVASGMGSEDLGQEIRDRMQWKESWLSSLCFLSSSSLCHPFSRALPLAPALLKSRTFPGGPIYTQGFNAPVYIDNLILTTIPWGRAIISPILQMSISRLSNLPKVTQLTCVHRQWFSGLCLHQDTWCCLNKQPSVAFQDHW